MNGKIKITNRGIQLLNQYNAGGGAYPNEIGIVAVLNDREEHNINEFKQYKFSNPPLERCVNYLLKNGYITKT